MIRYGTDVTLESDIEQTSASDSGSLLQSATMSEESVQVVRSYELDAMTISRHMGFSVEFRRVSKTVSKGYEWV
jgi:hypothetical protein